MNNFYFGLDFFKIRMFLFYLSHHPAAAACRFFCRLQKSIIVYDLFSFASLHIIYLVTGEMLDTSCTGQIASSSQSGHIARQANIHAYGTFIAASSQMQTHREHADSTQIPQVAIQTQTHLALRQQG